MEETIVMFLGDNEEVNAAALGAMERVPWVKVTIVNSTPTMGAMVELPCIDAEQGRRYYGLESIFEYAKRLSVTENA